jgi:hypothetical protein
MNATSCALFAAYQQRLTAVFGRDTGERAAAPCILGVGKATMRLRQNGFDAGVLQGGVRHVVRLHKGIIERAPIRR